MLGVHGEDSGYACLGDARQDLGIALPGATGPALTGSSVELRAEVSEDQMVRYSYSLDGRAFQPFGDAIALEYRARGEEGVVIDFIMVG